MAARFEFPPLSSTGEGPVLGEQRRLVWQSDEAPGFYVTEQRDVPAVAYRCHYEPRFGFCSGGAAPCDYATMILFIEFIDSQFNGA